MKIHNSSIDFYNRIAVDYDRKMEEDTPNREVRVRVKSYFLKNVDKGKILDFGAGTGLDLHWQLEQGYEIVFYEPSAKMAEVANKSHGIYENPVIQSMVDKEASIEHLRTLEDNSLDAVFSNFAALNSLENLDDVFSVFAQKLKPKGHLVCVLTYNFGFIDRMKSFLQNRIANVQKSVAKTVTMNGGYSMKVFYHSAHHLKQCGLRNALEFKIEIPLGFEDHVLTHFIKK